MPRAAAFDQVLLLRIDFGQEVHDRPHTRGFVHFDMHLGPDLVAIHRLGQGAAQQRIGIADEAVDQPDADSGTGLRASEGSPAIPTIL